MVMDFMAGTPWEDGSSTTSLPTGATMNEELEGLRTHAAATLANQHLLLEFIRVLHGAGVVSGEQVAAAIAGARKRLDASGTPEAIRASVMLEMLEGAV